MIKVKILELDKHRNETTFRPYVRAKNLLKEIGIEFVTDGSYDMVWIGQASILNKNVSLKESAESGIEFCNKIDGNYIIFDGQDSHSLMGVVEVLRGVDKKPLLVLKNTLLKNASLYKTGYAQGRYYWGAGEYSIPDIDDYWDIIRLSGSNWLSTLSVDFRGRYAMEKTVDISALFNYGTPGTEHGVDHSKYYTAHRNICVDQLKKLRGVTIALLNPGERIPEIEYYQRMAQCKIIMAPFGYGEIAPRDIQSAAMGGILIKPNMDHIITYPNPYIPNETYIPCSHTFDDIGVKVDQALKSDSMHYVENLKKFFETEYSSVKLVEYLYGTMISSLSSVLTNE